MQVNLFLQEQDQSRIWSVVSSSLFTCLACKFDFLSTILRQLYLPKRMSSYTSPGWIPYDPRNPLTFSAGQVQVKDLPLEEQIRRYLPEFRFVSRKRVTSIDQMTELEREQWMRALRDENAEVLQHIKGNDFFTLDEDEYYEGYNDELYIDTWEWTINTLYKQGVVTLTDIYGWPGDNQHGVVFIGKEPVFTNSDTHLTLIVGSPWAPILRERTDALSHLKSTIFCTESCQEHEHCKEQYCRAEGSVVPQLSPIGGSQFSSIPPQIPNFATVDEITQKLQRGEIQRWFIDPNQQVRGDEPNVRISFITKEGGLYLVRAKYDQRTNQIFPPVEVHPKEIPSLIKWENAHTIFNVGSQMNTITPKVPKGYSDREIEGKVSRNYYDLIFQSIDGFKFDRYQYYLRVVPTNTGEQSALMRQWSNKDTRLQFWITTSEPNLTNEVNPYIMNSGWAIIYGTPTTFLVVGNNGSHPFVMAPDFTFDNSDGSTDEDVDFPILNFDQVKYLLKSKVIEYVFNQIH